MGHDLEEPRRLDRLKEGEIARATGDGPRPSGKTRTGNASPLKLHIGQNNYTVDRKKASALRILSSGPQGEGEGRNFLQESTLQARQNVMQMTT
jgi:hypothetical protein